MVYFITVLRALACCIITNAHYTGIYPTDLIANGGLFGDILFFAISGYCLSKSNDRISVTGFCKWYAKRLWRVYLPVLITTLVFHVLGLYSVTGADFGNWYFYPTFYHFVASIVVLYIPLYFVTRIDVLRMNIGMVMIGTAVICLAIYAFRYDKSYYHIDNVYEPMIRFLFFESMLIGVWFKENDTRLRNNFKSVYIVGEVLSAGVYIVSKYCFSTNRISAYLQILNYFIILIFAFITMRLFIGKDQQFGKIPHWIKKPTTTISKLTLQIYVVQYAIIDVVREWHLSFPLNWFVLTTMVITSAMVLYEIENLIKKAIERMVKRETQ